MKSQIAAFVFFLFVTFLGCNSEKSSKEVASYSYEEEVVEMSDELKRITPDWVEKGKICYGLVVQIDVDKRPVKGKPVKAKVVGIGRNSIKMKALETVSLVQIKSCTKMRIIKGETWDEKEGDLFLTRQEAIDTLKANNLHRDMVTVD